MTDTVERRPAPKGWMRVKDWARENSFGVNQTYRLAKTGELASIRLGGKVLIAEDALARRLAATMQKAGAA